MNTVETVKAALAESRDSDEALICASMALQTALLYGGVARRNRLRSVLSMVLSEMAKGKDV